MTTAGDRYSFSLTTFSPTGKLSQIEYALKAVLSGQSSIGIKFRDGVVVVSDKKTNSSLIDHKSINKIAMIGPGLGVTYSGIGPDSRVLVSRARKSAQQYLQIHGEWPSVFQLVRGIASIMQEFTQSGGVRPFGASLLVFGYDGDNPALYQVDPSGSYWKWKACAIGKNAANARVFLEKRFQEEMCLEDAVHTALLALKNECEGSMNFNSIDVGIVSKRALSDTNRLLPEFKDVSSAPQFSLLTEQEIAEYLSNL